MFEISKDTMISEILEYAPESMPVFQNIGMHCLAAPSRVPKRWSRLASLTV